MLYSSIKSIHLFVFLMLKLNPKNSFDFCKGFPKVCLMAFAEVLL